MNNLIRNANRDGMISIIVEEGTVGIHIKNGKVIEVLGAGKHWKAPVSHEIKIVTVRPQVTDIPIEFYSKDRFQFKGDLRIFYRVEDPEKLVLSSAENLKEYLEKYSNSVLTQELNQTFSLAGYLDQETMAPPQLQSLNAINNVFGENGLKVDYANMVIVPPKNITEMQERKLQAEYEKTIKPIEAETEAKSYAIIKAEEIKQKLEHLKGVTEAIGNLDQATQYIVAMNLFGNSKSDYISEGIQEDISYEALKPVTGEPSLAELALRRSIGQRGVAVLNLTDLIKQD